MATGVMLTPTATHLRAAVPQYLCRSFSFRVLRLLNELASVARPIVPSQYLMVNFSYSKRSWSSSTEVCVERTDYCIYVPKKQAPWMPASVPQEFAFSKYPPKNEQNHLQAI
ncbi:hypothetical protein GALMADRAFT_147391 [Galerina marginata CBS 339.88]|uniref:Uncharacterized protein n=1 Tax=Galerina marginata (strain CBS 339.88) TaxID=685588 RepID=A0A067SK97_GALM3|nr:hypothetical protein GALMADRAFT_147391 [Galerina marginata CBS 339.88]